MDNHIESRPPDPDCSEQPHGVLRVAGEHLHIYTFTQQSHRDVLRLWGQQAANPNYPLQWDDAAYLMMRAWERLHGRAFPQHPDAT